MNWVVRNVTDAEMQLTAVERMREYMEIKVERSVEDQGYYRPISFNNYILLFIIIIVIIDEVE